VKNSNSSSSRNFIPCPRGSSTSSRALADAMVMIKLSSASGRNGK
jgi:hypothetical protein